jgi:hypothetical protein
VVPSSKRRPRGGSSIRARRREAGLRIRPGIQDVVLLRGTGKEAIHRVYP